MRLLRTALALTATCVVVTGCAGEPAEPAPVVVSFDDGWGQVFVMDLDGSGVRQVTPTVADDTVDSRAGYAALSPDGTELAYTRAGRFIDIVDLESGAVRTVYEGGYQPVYSPDGSMLAFTTAGGESITIVDTDGTNARVVDLAEHGTVATLSPDGLRILVTVSGYLVEAPVTGGPSMVVLRDQFWNADPAYSPDGSTLVFSSNRGGNNGSEIYSMPAAGGAITPLTDTYAVHPEFTPDGTRILYTRATTPTGEPVTDTSVPTRPELASMNPDGSDQKRLTPRSISAQNPSIGGGR
ncbi:TolB family protein [Rhodococcus sp. NPDC058532]|uniref:TolB family protein n=1 Tax=Rhodococcus sp. NPDC058532 TaxID=3346540 RepID=UPI003660EA02